MNVRYEVFGTAFEWNANKAEANIANHGVSFEEAALAFCDGENRFILLGRSGRRILLVVHVERGPEIRITSARAAEPKERSQYERYSSGK